MLVFWLFGCRICSAELSYDFDIIDAKPVGASGLFIEEFTIKGGFVSSIKFLCLLFCFLFCYFVLEDSLSAIFFSNSFASILTMFILS
jgi:hypothetical protein